MSIVKRFTLLFVVHSLLLYNNWSGMVVAYEKIEQVLRVQSVTWFVFVKKLCVPFHISSVMANL